MGRTHLCGEHEFRRINIHGDDRAGASEPRTLHGSKPDGAATDHHYGIAVRDRTEIERSAGAIIAVDIDPAKLVLAAKMGATHGVDASKDDAIAAAKRETNGRGVDVVIEAAGSAAAFRVTSEAVRPGGQIIWLGKIDVNKDVSFRWGSLMQEKRIRRVSYGNTRPRRDFPLLARSYLDGDLMLDELISRRITLEEINDGFAALKRGETIRSVVMFD